MRVYELSQNLEQHEKHKDLGLGFDTFRFGDDREGRSEIPGQEPGV